MHTVAHSHDLEERVRRVVREVLALDDLPCDLDCSITEELAVDSLDQLSLFMAFEDEFGARIREEDASRLSTLRDVVEYVRAHADMTRAR